MQHSFKRSFMFVTVLLALIFAQVVPAFAAIPWAQVGAAGFTPAEAYNSSLAFNGSTPYVAYTDDFANGYKASVMKFDGTNWVQVGAAGFTADSAGYVRLAFNGSTPYVAYADGANDSKASVMKFDGTNWVQVGAAGFSAASMTGFGFSFAIDNGGVPYVAYQDSANAYKTTVMKFDGTNWAQVGANFGGGFSSLAFDGSTPYVAYQNLVGGKAGVMKFDGSAWVQVGAADFSAGQTNSNSLAFNGSTPYLAYGDGANSNKASVMKFDGSAWVQVGAAGFTGDPGMGLPNPSLAFNSAGTPYVAYVDGDPGDPPFLPSVGALGKASVMKFDGSAWVQVGAAGFSAGQVLDPSLAIYNDIPYVAYTDVANAYKASVMNFAETGFTVTFDGNGSTDGSTAAQTASSATALTSNGFTRTGYNFAGWDTVALGGGTAYTDGESYPFIASETLYAQWTAASQTLTFNSNGGTAVTAITQDFDTSVSAPTDPTKSGYAFAGWFSDNGTFLNAYTFPHTMGLSTTVYAKWTDNTPPTVISSVRANANPTTAVSVNFTVTFSESVSGVDITDFTLTMDGGVSGATVSSVAAIPLAPNIDGASTLNKTISNPVTISNSYTVTVNTGSGGGILLLNVVDDDTIVDMASNPLNGVFTSGEAYVINKGDTTGVFRPTNGALYLKNTNTTGIADNVLTYGLPGDKPVTGDWDGNGTDTIGIYRGNTFYLRNSNTNGFGDIVFTFGQAGDQPIAGDWNGDGIDTIGVYRSSTRTFYLRNYNSSGNIHYQFSFGLVGDVAIVGDWDGNGTDTIGTWRNGAVYLRNSNSAGLPEILFSFGIAGDKPIAGDWNDDGIDTIGVYRTDLFYLRNTNTTGLADFTFTLGIPGDIPIAGNWDGLP